MATQANTGSTSGSEKSKNSATSGLSSNASSGSTAGSSVGSSYGSTGSSFGSTSGSSFGSTADSSSSGLTAKISQAIDPQTMDQLNHFKDEAMDKASVYYDQSTRYIRQNPFYFIGGAALLGFLIGSMVSKGRSNSL